VTFRRTVAATLTLLLGAATLSACTGQDQQGSAAHRMSEWVSGTGLGNAIGTLIIDNERVPKDVPNGTGAVHAACGALLDDAEQANGELPSPDDQVSISLSNAYADEGTAGNECYSAGATNPALLAKAQRNMIKAEALFTQVLLRIASIDGKTVSTSTTTQPASGNIFG
jgi:predicted small secreted protein